MDALRRSVFFALAVVLGFLLLELPWNGDVFAIPQRYVIDNLLTTVRHNMTVPGLVALYTALTGSAATEVGSTTSRAYFTDRYRRVLVTLTEAVRIAQSEGLVKAEHNPATIARLLVAASDGLQTQWLLNPRVDMAGDLEALWRLVLLSE